MGRSDLKHRLEKLRRERGLQSQGALASALGVAQSALSEWGRGANRPSAESFIKLGNMAKSLEDRLWFWEKAGLDTHLLRAAAQELLDKHVHVAESDMVYASRLREARIQRHGVSVGATEELRRLGFVETVAPDIPEPVPRKLVPNPGAVRYWKVVQSGHGLLGRTDTVVVLDTSENDATDLTPFWGRVVLLESTGEEEPTFRDVPRPGVHMGRLLAQPSAHRPQKWYAVFGDPERTDMPFNAEDSSPAAFAVGKCSVPYAIYDDPDQARERAESDLRLFTCYRILGRVLYWYRHHAKIPFHKRQRQARKEARRTE